MGSKWREAPTRCLWIDVRPRSSHTRPPLSGGRGSVRAPRGELVPYPQSYSNIEVEVPVQLSRRRFAHDFYGWDCDVDGSTACMLANARAVRVKYGNLADVQYRFYLNAASQPGEYWEFPEPAFYWKLDVQVPEHCGALSRAPWWNPDVTKCAPFLALYSFRGQGGTLPGRLSLTVSKCITHRFRTRMVSATDCLVSYTRLNRNPYDAENVDGQERLVEAYIRDERIIRRYARTLMGMPVCTSAM